MSWLRVPACRWCLTAVALLAIALGSPRAQAAMADGTLVVGTKAAAPFSYQDGDGEWRGLAIDLWRQVAQRLELRYELREADIPELLAGAANNEFDVVAAAITVTAEREAQVNFSHPYYTTGLGIATNSEQHWPLWLRILGALLTWEFLQLIGALLLVLLIAGGLVWVFERRDNAEQFGGTTAEGLAKGLWWSAVTMTTVGYGDKAPRTLGGRAVGLVWMFMSLMLVSSFTAGIASSLTVSGLASRVHGPEDLPYVRLGVIENTAAASEAERRGWSMLAYPSLDEALVALASGNVHAVIHDAPILQYQLRQPTSPPNVTLLPEFVYRQDYAFIVDPTNPEEREVINRALLEVLESDAYRRIEDQYLGH